MPPTAAITGDELYLRFPFGNGDNAINLLMAARPSLGMRQALVVSPAGVAATLDVMGPTFSLRDPWAALLFQPTIGLALAEPGVHARAGAIMRVVPQTHGGPIDVIPFLSAGASFDGRAYVTAGVDLHTGATDSACQGALTLGAGYDAALGGFNASVGLSVMLDRSTGRARAGALTRIPSAE